MNFNISLRPRDKAAASRPRGQSRKVEEASTLLPYLFRWLDKQSKTSVKALLERGQAWVNGKPVTRHDYPLNMGDEVFICYEKPRQTFHHSQLKVVWEDDHLIVVDKKDGLLAVDNPVSDERSAFSLLLQHAEQTERGLRGGVFILHRLDKGTSGLMMFARNREIQEYMRDNWHEAITRRTYIALVEGQPEKSEGRIVTYLAENSRMKVYCTTPQQGKKAVSYYRTLQSNKTYTLLEIELETGRKNQIRAQMEYIGHPVAGDAKYGARTNPANRLMLHASRLFFVHPASGREMRFEAGAPSIFNKLVKNA